MNQFYSVSSLMTWLYCPLPSYVHVHVILDLYGATIPPIRNFKQMY